MTQTFTEEIASKDAVFLATVKLPTLIELGLNLSRQEIPRAKFQIVTIVKGKELVKPAQTIEAIYFEISKAGTSPRRRLDPPKLMWFTPTEISKST